MISIRSLGLAFVAATALATGALAAGAAMPTEDRIPATGGDITVRSFHHASLLLTHGNQRILVDPAPAPGQQGGNPVATFQGTNPTIILVTDVHGDHLNGDVLTAVAGNATIVAPQAVIDDMKFPAALKAKTRALANGATTTINGVQIQAVPMYNITQDRLQFHAKGRGNGYVVTVGGKRIYIAGDTEDIPEMRALQNIDAAFIPFNLPYTMTPQQAASAVQAFKPKIVYPYHFGMSDVAAFRTQVGNASEVRMLKWY